MCSCRSSRRCSLSTSVITLAYAFVFHGEDLFGICVFVSTQQKTSPPRGVRRETKWGFPMVRCAPRKSPEKLYKTLVGWNRQSWAARWVPTQRWAGSGTARTPCCHVSVTSQNFTNLSLHRMDTLRTPLPHCGKSGSALPVESVLAQDQHASTKAILLTKSAMLYVTLRNTSP